MKLILLSTTFLLPIIACNAHTAGGPAETASPDRQAPVEKILISDEEALSAGKKVWMNEAGGTVEKLTHWNQGEEFASLGIGHFIWYTSNKPGPFEESFPPMIAFLRQQGAQPPAWLETAPHCPWETRDEFFRDFHSSRLMDLRQFLSREDIVALQTRFMARRLENSLPKILDALPADERPEVQRQFYRVANSLNGIYSLLDYVNFKGEGVSPTERYNGQGWGLLQVLQGMTGSQIGQPALDAFAVSANETLTRRLRNSPPERNEQRWLPNWKKRIETYRQP